MRNSSGRNNKFLFYFSGLVKELIPDTFYRYRFPQIIDRLKAVQENEFFNRLHYYNKLQPDARLADATPELGDLNLPRKGRVYYLDARETVRYFDSGLKANFLFGDNTKIPSYPSLTKSRPIQAENQNAVLMKYNKVRHFAFVEDPVPFERKADRLIGMAEVKQPNRKEFYAKYFGHPKMDLGQINSGTSHDQWHKPRISIRHHLDYKFILCLEGYDVASNLKWVMSSGSLAVMPPPTNETWFMEAKLVPDVHYVAISPDFSDVEERMEYFRLHPAHAKEIIRNANLWVEQFTNPETEFLLEVAVILKYFMCTGQDIRISGISQSFLSDLLHTRR